MALFGNNSKKEGAEYLVREKLSKHEVVDVFVNGILENEVGEKNHQWINTVMGYYDERGRTIVVGPDLLAVFNCTTQKLFFDKENQYESTGLHFTDLGYTPLPGFYESGNNVNLSQQRVAELLAGVVRDKMVQKYGDYKISEVGSFMNPKSKTFEVAYFSYTLPELSWKKWF